MLAARLPYDTMTSWASLTVDINGLLRVALAPRFYASSPENDLPVGLHDWVMHTTLCHSEAPVNVSREGP
ncbi:hypothetical protein F1880_009730 [Penicillium rolfsii]|nr:hypothetical protein F1880_009730 [Penicillium rolfsii]